MKTSVLFLLCLSFLSCGAMDRQYEDYNLKTEDDLTLTAGNHSHGWQKRQCFYCHVKANIHQVNRIKSSVFDSAKDTVEARGINGCYLCHGSNGN